MAWISANLKVMKPLFMWVLSSNCSRRHVFRDSTMFQQEKDHYCLRISGMVWEELQNNFLFDRIGGIIWNILNYR